MDITVNNKSFIIGDGKKSSFVINHNIGKLDYMVDIYNAETSQLILINSFILLQKGLFPVVKNKYDVQINFDRPLNKGEIKVTLIW